MSTIMHILLCIEILICVGIFIGYKKETFDDLYYTNKEGYLIRSDFCKISIFFMVILLMYPLSSLAYYRNDTEISLNLASFVIAPTIISLFGFATICHECRKEIQKLRRQVGSQEFKENDLRTQIFLHSGIYLPNPKDLINKYQEQLCNFLYELKPNNFFYIEQKTKDIIYYKFYSIISEEDLQEIKNAIDKENALRKKDGTKLIDIHDLDEMFAKAFKNFLFTKFLDAGIKYYTKNRFNNETLQKR